MSTFNTSWLAEILGVLLRDSLGEDIGRSDVVNLGAGLNGTWDSTEKELTLTAPGTTGGGACMIAQNSSTPSTALTKDVYSELAGTYAAVGTPDASLTVAGSGVGVTYNGVNPARILVNVSMRVAYNGADVTYAMCPHVNGSPVASIVAEALVLSTAIDSRIALSALVDVVHGDVLKLLVTNITDGTDMLSRRLNATFVVLPVAV